MRNSESVHLFYKYAIWKLVSLHYNCGLYSPITLNQFGQTNKPQITKF